MAFDDFARRRDEERQTRERLANEIRSEWEILKGFVSQFALDRRSIEGHTFAWVPDLSGRPLLVLNFVSAMLCGGERVGAQPDYQIIFSRKPAWLPAKPIQMILPFPRTLGSSRWTS
jgi:hypothetical protein